MDGMDSKITTECDLLIQRARPRDLPGIVALRERNLMRYDEKGDLPLTFHHETIWRRCAEAISSPLSRVDVVLDQELVVGCLFLRLAESPLNMTRLIGIQEVFVIEPPYRGRGLGQRLLERGEQWAKENGAELLALVCHTGEGLESWFATRGYPQYETFCVKRLE